MHPVTSAGQDDAPFEAGDELLHTLEGVASPRQHGVELAGEEEGRDKEAGSFEESGALVVEVDSTIPGKRPAESGPLEGLYRELKLIRVKPGRRLVRPSEDIEESLAARVDEGEALGGRSIPGGRVVEAQQRVADVGFQLLLSVLIWIVWSFMPLRTLSARPFGSPSRTANSSSVAVCSAVRVARCSKRRLKTLLIAYGMEMV